MLWLAAYLTGFPPVGLHALRWTHGLAPMWSGLYLISTKHYVVFMTRMVLRCQCSLGLIPHFYGLQRSGSRNRGRTVSMPSRAYTSFLHRHFVCTGCTNSNQVSMPSRAYTSFLHPDIQFGFVEAYKAVSMPSRAYTSFLQRSCVMIP